MNEVLAPSFDLPRAEPSFAARPEALREAAQDFEALFLAQMLAGMTKGLAADGPMLGGGDADPFRHMLTDEIGKLISRSGGVGVADAILREMLKVQEVA